MEDHSRVVRFSSIQNSAQLDKSVDIKKGNNIKNFKEMEIGRFYTVALLFSIATFILEFYFHCWIAFIYFREKETKFLALTSGFIVTPALVSTAFSMRCVFGLFSYVKYLKERSKTLLIMPMTVKIGETSEKWDEDEPSMKRQPLWKWGVRVIMLMLQLAPLLRYYDTLVYGIMSEVHKKKGNHLNQQKYLRLMLDEETNASLLRLLCCFLMSAPQAIIQFVFLLSQYLKKSNNARLTAGDVFSGTQSLAILFSIISISWALTAYHRSVRLARDDKEKLSPCSTLLMLCWNIFSTSSRILALSLLATLYPAWFITICAVHWLFMSLWIDVIHHQSAICGTRCEEIIFNVALGLAYVVAFISPKDGPTRYSYLAYYLVCFMENTAALVVWSVAGSLTKQPELHYGVVAIQLLSFFFCIFFMFLYYRCYHPSRTSTVIRKTINITQIRNSKS